MLLLLAITRYTNNCITVHRLHSDCEALPLRANKHIVQFHSTVFIIIDISTLDTTSGDEVPTNTSCRSPAYEMSLPQFPAFSLSEGNLNLGPRWAKWLSRFNRLMVAMEIADPPRKQALLLHYAGPEIDEIYDTLPIEAAAADGSPIDTYESTANALTRYFTPKTNAAFEIYNFRQAKQEATETIDAFVTRLRKLAKTCNFSNTDGEVTNQIIFACHSQSLRRRALRDDLSLDKLVAAARALELSETQAATVEGRDRHVNAVRPHTPADRGRQRSHGHGRSQSRRPAPSRQLTGDNVKRNTCDNCGYELPHKSKECPARGKSCTSCNKVGHFASVCRSSQQRSSHHTPRDSRHTSTSTSRANVVTTDREPTDDHYVFSNTSDDSTIPTRQVFIEGEQVEVIIDTGASVNVLESSTYFALPNRPSLRPTHTRVFPYGERSPLPVLGMAKFEFAYNSERLQVTFHVVEGKGGNLLGYTAAEKLRILSLAAHVTTTKAERRVRSCLACQATTSTPITPEPIISTPLPAVPWKALSADFLGPLPTGELLLVVMDDFSRFPEVEIVSSTASTTVIPKLDSIFARQGIPEILKTDNGPPFNGGELTQFANHLGFHHRKVTPLWPCANGEVERFMASLMKAIRAAHVEQRSWKQELYTFLRQYRATPHCTTGVSPSEVLNQRQMRVTLPQLPQQAQTSESDTQLRHRDAANKAKAKAYSDRRRHAKQSDLQVGDTVLVRQPRRNKLSTPYDARPLEIITRSGSMITAQRGDYTITRNASFFKRFDASPTTEATDDYNEFDDTARVPPDAEPANDALRPCLRQPDDIRRSGRARRPPVRFEDYVGPGEL